MDEFHLPNDFEILGICFRTEVERFLFIFDEHYNFQTDLPRNPDLHPPSPSPVPLPTPPPNVRSRRDTPPHFQSQRNSVPNAEPAFEQPRTPTRSGWYNHDPVTARRRQSNIYHTEDGTARALRAHRNARTNTQAPTSRMREVLNNIGGTFDDPVHSTQDRDRPASSTSRANQGRAPGPPGDDPGDGDDDGRRGHNQRPPRPPGRPHRQPPHDHRPQGGNGPPDGDPDDGDDGGNGGNGGRGPRRGRNEPDRQGIPCGQEPHFDLKLKFENVPKWDGNTDTIVRWLSKVNNIARMSPTVFAQLGAIVPRRLEGTAETWYWSLPIDYRDAIEQNWDTLRGCISSYYMNQKWLDKQKARAIRAFYRDQGHARESPSEYYIRKAELLNTVYTMNDSEVILEVMEGAPASWNTVLTTQLYTDVIEFQSTIRFHEDTLMRLDPTTATSYRRDRYEAPPFRDSPRDPIPFRDSRNFNPRVNLVGSSKGLEPPKFPRDDSNISKRSATPEDKGAQPCRHCGSGKHWDNECKYAFKGNRAARANLAMISEDDSRVQQEYNELYYRLDSEADERDHTRSDQDFRDSLQIIDPSSQPIYSNGTPLQDGPNLEGDSPDQSLSTKNSSSIPESAPIISHSRLAATVRPETTQPKPLFCAPYTAKPPLNRRTRRRLARDISAVSYSIQRGNTNYPTDKVVELKKFMARPPGCAFLGSRATQTTVTVGGPDLDPMKIIVDSGSDITLISQKTLEKLTTKLKVRAG